MRLRLAAFSKIISVLFLLSIGQLPAVFADTTEPLVIAYRFDSEPIQFTNEAGNADGMLIDIWRLWSEIAGRPVRFVAGTNKETQNMLKQGRADILAGLFSNDRRAGFLDFSESILSSPYHVYFNSDIKGLNTTDDLKNFRVAVTRGSFHEDYMRQHFSEVPLILVDGYGEMFVAANKNDIDVFITQPLYLNRYVTSVSSRNRYLRLQDPIYTRSYKASVKKGNKNLLRLINRYLPKITDADKAEISARWIGVEWSGKTKEKIVLTLAEKSWLKKHPIIEIGIDGNWPPVDFVDDKGSHSGIVSDYLKYIAKSLGVEFEVQQSSNFNTMLSKVRSGQLNIGATIVRTDEREKDLIFTDEFFIVLKSIVMRENNHGVSDIKDLYGKVIAIEDGFSTQKQLQKLHPELNLKKYATTTDALKAVSWGEADAYIGNRAVAQWLRQEAQLTNLLFVADAGLGPAPQRFAVNKYAGWTLLQTMINKVLRVMPEEEKRAILNRWLSGVEEKPVAQLQLTDQEKLWLKTHNKIRLGVDPSWPPFEFFNDQDEYSGLGADFFQLFNKQLNLEVQPVDKMKWSQVLAEAKLKNIDVLPAISASAERRKYLNFTKPYLVYPYVIFVHEDVRFVTGFEDLHSKNVAVVKSYATEELIRNRHPDVIVKTYETSKDALLALSQGSVDAFVGNLSAGLWMIDKLGLNNLKIAAPTPYQFNQSIGVRKDWPELITILNKVIDDVNAAQKQAIKNRWFSVGFDYQANTAALWRVALITATVALVIVLLMLYWNRKLQSEIVHRREIEKKLEKAKNTIIQAGEEQFNNLTEGSIQGIWIHVDWKPLFSNQALATMLGYESADEITALPSIEQCIAPHERGRLRAYSKARKAGKSAPEHYEMDAVRKDGKVITVDNVVRRVKWHGATAYQSTMVDITARKEIEKQLMEEKILAESIIESLPGTFFMLDKEGLLLHWNRNLEITTGLAAEQLKSTKGFDLVHNRHRQRAEQSLHDVMTDGATLVELDIQSNSGDAVPFLISCVRTKIGSHTRIIGVSFDISQQHKTEQDLRDSEIGLAEAQRIAHMGNWSWNLETEEVFWADEVFRIFGYQPNDFAPDADKFAQHIHPDDHAVVMQAAKNAVQTGVVELLDFRIVREDHIERTVRIEGKFKSNEAGEKNQIIGILQDITDRKQAEKALAERERQFRDLIEGSIQGIVILRDNKALFANHAMAKILGLSSVEDLLATDDVLSLVAPYHRTRVLEHTQAWAESNGSLPNIYEFDALRADGKTITLENVGRRVNWQGKTAVQCTYVDITERRKAENALRSSQERLLATQKIAHLGSWEWTFDKEQMIWADETYKLLGYEPGEIEAGFHAFMARVHVDDQDVMRRTVAAAAEKHQPYDIQFRAVMPDGEEKYIYAFGNVVVDADGRAEKLIGTVQDISHRIQAERSRELEFTNIKLRELDELKSMFIASMSHELRTPLNSIIGFTGVLLQGLAGPINEEQSDQLQRVYNSGKHLLALITDVIDISKIEAGRVDVYAEAVDICELINDVIASVRGDAEKINLVINFTHSSTCVVSTDKKRCYQCVLNLVSNAVKYSEHGQIDIALDETEDMLSIIVKDTGIGISSDDLKNLFIPFERMESKLKVVRGGTGLGLYLTKKMAIELLGGDVSVKSVLGKGSTFTMKLAKLMDVSGYVNNLNNDVRHNESQSEKFSSHRTGKHIVGLSATPHSEDVREFTQENVCREKLAFIASMSHELRTPLNSIIGFSGILNKGMAGALTTQQSDQMSRIQNAAYQLLLQVSSVIDLAKIGIEDLSPVYVSFVLKEVVESAASMIDIAAKDKNLSININVSQNIQLYTDSMRLKECIVHLLDNAIRYSDYGEVEIRAKVEGEFLHLEVLDTANVNTDDWLQDSQQLNGNGNNQGKLKQGLGLSLYLVRYITTNILNGELQFEKRKNGGTNAKLSLPMRIHQDSVQ